MPNVICLGELLIDFSATEEGVSVGDAPGFTKAPGGAPANVAVAVRRLGETSGFIGAVGEDPFGDYLRAVLDAEDVDTGCLVATPDVRTTLAFVASRPDGGKDFAFYRNPGADMMLAPEHVDERYLRSADALHYGSISRIDESPRGATDTARRIAADAGLMVSYDPNWRPTLWADRAAARERISEGFEGAAVTKISADEWEFVTGHAEFDAGVRAVLDRGVQLVVRSDGGEGMRYATAGESGFVESCKVDVVDTLGAGDASMGGLITGLLGPWREGVSPSELDAGDLERIVGRANAVAALACTAAGAIPSLPTASQLARFLLQ